MFKLIFKPPLILEFKIIITAIDGFQQQIYIMGCNLISPWFKQKLSTFW